jgi:hypothetical protein
MVICQLILSLQLYNDALLLHQYYITELDLIVYDKYVGI